MVGMLEGLGALGASYVGMASDEAADLAHAGFGVDGVAARLATEKDDTFRIDSEGEQRFILKVANPAEDAAEIALQVELLGHIAARDPSLPVPRVVPDREGRASHAIHDRAGQHRVVQLLTYLDGAPLDTTRSSAAERERIGEMLGRCRTATATFTHPADTRVLVWDVTHLKRLAPLLGEVTETPWRAALTRGMERFAAIEGALPGLRRQVLHNDFSRSNIIVDHAAPQFVTGVIDFGDAVRTAIAIDLATALLNQLPRDLDTNPADDIFADGRDLLRGYCRTVDLMPAEAALVPHLVMGRIVTRALLSLARAKRFPDNAPYLLRNTAPGWAQLDWFLRRSPDAVSATLLDSAA